MKKIVLLPIACSWYKESTWNHQALAFQTGILFFASLCSHVAVRMISRCTHMYICMCAIYYNKLMHSRNIFLHLEPRSLEAKNNLIRNWSKSDKDNVSQKCVNPFSAALLWLFVFHAASFTPQYMHCKSKENTILALVLASATYFLCKAGNSSRAINTRPANHFQLCRLTLMQSVDAWLRLVAALVFAATVPLIVVGMFAVPGTTLLESIRCSCALKSPNGEQLEASHQQLCNVKEPEQIWASYIIK